MTLRQFMIATQIATLCKSYEKRFGFNMAREMLVEQFASRDDIIVGQTLVLLENEQVITYKYPDASIIFDEDRFELILNVFMS